jgi:hypothetical protein
MSLSLVPPERPGPLPVLSTFASWPAGPSVLPHWHWVQNLSVYPGLVWALVDTLPATCVPPWERGESRDKWEHPASPWLHLSWLPASLPSSLDNGPYWRTTGEVGSTGLPLGHKS